jgi:hypothetical protein
VIYFSGSVKGLEVGAPVQLKGVNIGKVIEMHPESTIMRSQSFLNQVIFDVAKGIRWSCRRNPAPERTAKKVAFDRDNSIEDMIENGVSCQAWTAEHSSQASCWWPLISIRIRDQPDGVR